jgi:hypothetical protein
MARQVDAVDAWLPGIDSARRAVRHANDAMVFLHLAKSGGTTVRATIIRHPKWHDAPFPQSTQRVGAMCTCSDPNCTHALESFEQIAALTPNVVRGSRLLVTNGHATFGQSRWLARAVAPRGTVVQILMSVRPARSRLVSLFRDYWNDYYRAVRDQAGELDLTVDDPTITKTEHGRSERNKLVRDSQRFLLADSKIDGRFWFESFNPGRGYPFWLHEIFESPAQMVSAMESGELRVVPLARLDDLIIEMTAQPPSRFRVSTARVPEVEAALEQSADIIDRLSDQDREYDALLADRFGADF